MTSVVISIGDFAARNMTSQVIDSHRGGRQSRVWEGVVMHSYSSLAGPLRSALIFNAAFSALCAIGSWAYDTSLGAEFAGEPAATFEALALGLLGFAAWIVWQATRANPPLFLIATTIVLDLLWVVGSAALLAIAGDSLRSFAVLLVVAVAAVVGAAAVGQMAGIAYLIRERDARLGTQTRYELTVDVDVGAEAYWTVLADLGAIVSHSRSVVAAELAGQCNTNLGLGVVRTCRDTAGRQWSEEVTEWNESRSLQLRFASEAANFPFPLHPMLGGWRLEARGAARTRVTVWWSFTTRPVWAAPLFVPMLDLGVRRDMTRVIRSMADAARQPVSPPTLADAHGART